MNGKFQKRLFWSCIYSKTEDILRRLNFDIDLKARIGDLPVEYKGRSRKEVLDI